jgi:hypothetical protein
MLDDLPGLPTGECFVWSPQWLRMFRRETILPKRTFDSTSTPRGKRGTFRGQQLKPLDLKEFQAKMADAIEQAKANDPKELKRRIAELDRKVKAMEAAKPAPAGKPAKAVDVVKLQRQIDAAVSKRDREWAAYVTKCRRSYITLARAILNISKATKEFEADPWPDNGPEFAPSVLDAAAVASSPTLHVRHVETPSTSVRRSAPAAKHETNGDATIGGADGKMISILANWPAGEMTRTQWAAQGGVRASGSTMRGYVARLRKAGMIEQHGGRFVPTPHAVELYRGQDAATLSPDEVRATWQQKLGGGVATIIDLLHEHGRQLTREYLAEQLGVDPSGSTMRGYMAKLRGNNLITESADGICLVDELL